VKAADFSELLGIEFLDSSLDEVAEALDLALNGTGELVEPARRMLNAGGKRLRPLLTIASAVSCEPNVQLRPLDSRVRRGAASVELVHVGSLVHDDIMDEALSRRGVPTVNAVEGAHQALLVGDFLLARAGVEAAHVSKDVAMSLAVTISDLCDGQSLEGLFQNQARRQVVDAIESIKGKTGALMRAACDIGALAVERLDLAPALADFGMNFGIAFQLVDDLLDLLSTAELMGKPVNNDVRAGVFTVPMLLTVQAAAAAERERLIGLMKAAAGDADAAAEFRTCVLAGDAVRITLELVEKYNALAREALLAVPAGATRDGLAEVPDRYLNEILEEKAPATRR
jgi:geranylgeranyl pyrophosphate synthase